jgi:membrane-bound ClpP family serine protease
MLAVHKLDKKIGLALFIHTPGGSLAATESLVDYIRRMFGENVRAFVPQIAMSAGTMLACSCKEIYMGTHSNLGPVDPSVNGIQAQAVLAEIELAYGEMKRDQSRALVWHPILSRYNPSFVQLCQWAVERSEQFVTKSLMDNMLNEIADEAARKTEAQRIARALIDLSKNKGHDKHLHVDECETIGLKVKRLEEDKDLRDLVLTVHHCYMHTLANTPAFKIVENHLGRRMVKIAQQQVMLLQQPTPAPALPTNN